MARVLRVVTRLNIGGPARQALLLTRDLRDEFPTLLVTGWTDTREGELSDPDVLLRRVPLTRPVSPLNDLRAVPAVRKILVEHQSQLLHTHMAKAGTVGRLAALSLSPKPRMVHTFHGHVLEGYFSRPLERAFITMERLLARATDALVVVSPEIKDALLDLRIGRPNQYHVLPVGLDLDAYLSVSEPTGQLRSELCLESTTPLVGVIGRLVPIKDHSTLLRAMLELPHVHLAVLGDGELRAALESEVARLGLDERVHFTGWREDLPRDVADLDVVALTSRNEGTPVALIEALAAAIPVVATDVGGVRSVVEHGISGLLASPGDYKVIARHLAHLLADRSEASKMGQAGRTHVTRHFGAQRLLDDTRALYRTLV